MIYSLAQMLKELREAMSFILERTRHGLTDLCNQKMFEKETFREYNFKLSLFSTQNCKSQQGEYELLNRTTAKFRFFRKISSCKYEGYFAHILWYLNTPTIVKCSITLC